MEPDNYVFVSKQGKPVNFVTLHCIFAKIRKKANLYFPELKDINQGSMTSDIVLLQTFLKVGIKKEKRRTILTSETLHIFGPFKCIPYICLPKYDS